MSNTDKTINGQALSYEIFDDGYEIYLDENYGLNREGRTENLLTKKNPMRKTV